MNDIKRLNRMYDEMMNDLKYSKIAAFTKQLQTKEIAKKETMLQL